MTKEDLLNNYFKQSLSEKEEREFRLLLDNDPDFKATYEEYENFNLAFKSHEANELKGFLKSIDEKSTTKKITWYKKPVFYYAAAALLVVALCVPFLLKPSSNALYKDYFEIYPNVEQPIVRGSEQTNNSEAFKVYENGNYEAATKAFETILEKDSNPNYRFYYAMSLLNSNQYNNALQQLNQIKGSSYSAEINWYTALIYIKKKDFTKAKQRLVNLTSESKFKNKEAKALLDILGSK